LRKSGGNDCDLDFIRADMPRLLPYAKRTAR
jgi:hypothetical protein